MSLKTRIEIPKYSLSEELISAISHGVGAILSLIGLILLLIHSKNTISIISSIIYGVNSFILYLMSTLYHSLKVNNAKRVFRIFDHCSIYLLIAGTYTPYCLISMNHTLGWIVFSIIWICAIIGITFNAINLKKFKVFSMILYFVMGWMVIFSFKSLLKSVDINCLYLMLIAGILYTIGSIFYGVGKKKKYMHSIFHFFVLIASILFFLSIYFYVI